MNEWDDLLYAKRDSDTPFPPLMCKKMRMWELQLQWHPPIFHSLIHTSALPCCRLEPGAHVISSLDRPRSIPMPFTLTHTYIHGTCMHIFLYLARLCHGSPAWRHVALHTLTWQSPPPPPHCCRSVNEQLQSGGRFNHTGT